MNTTDKIEILEIRKSLDRLARIEVLSPEIRSACSQAGSLLLRVRKIVLGGGSDKAIADRLRELLAQQGEG